MQHTDPATDSVYFRAALGRFATGVTVITASDSQGALLGLTVNSFNAVSLDPPLVLWSLAKKSSALPGIVAATRYTIHVLGAHQTDLAMRFASGTHADRFDNLPMTTTSGGSPMLNIPVAAWFECEPHGSLPAGDHVILVARVRQCSHSDTPPLVFHAGGFDLTPGSRPAIS
ncbi:MAG: flavin reductase family protein [Burkholderiaceae bacterium]|nr:flavin reductase family protein [Burkholderiaceae bacterium]